MIPVNEFRNIASEQNPQYRVLKPWWDVFSEYLCIAMLMIGVFGCTVQLTQEKISCLPNRIFTSHDGDGDCNHLQEKTANESLLWEYSITKELKPNVIEVFGRKNGLDIHQYVFVNHYCYERAVHWYAKFFPYLVVIHSMVFMVASSFWFKFPGTSSKIELFVNILRKCFDSPWTTRAISEVSEERGEEKMVNLRKVSISSGHKIINPDGFAGTDGENITLLRSASVVSGGGGEKKLPEPAASVLDKKEGEQAKALFEKVKKFRTHVEEDDLLYKMYVIQTSLKVLKFVLIIIYAASLVSKIEIVVKCSVPPDLTGFKTFCCNHNRANLFSKLAYCYICFVGVYGLMCIYSLYWLFHRPLKEYSFEQVRLETGMNDIPDMKNDFAFLLHLSDRYDPLYAKRFAVFLSEVSESRLRQVNLNHEWTTKKLRARLSRNAGQRLELHLFMLTGLPDTVFEVPEIQSLKMELLSNITIPATLTQLPDLQELLLIHCSTKLQMAALNHLQANLKVLRVTFEGLEQMPLWMYSLQALEELHLSGPLNQEASRGGGSATLDTLRELKNLRVLTLRCHLTKLPPGVVDVAAQLQRLCVHNEGVKLQVLSNLKKLSNLTSLELMGCHLERIPSAVFSLNSLQELDLRENKLTTVEEILSLQHCQRLTTLRLWHNAVAYIPEHISKLHALETLDASWNKIRRLPSRLYYCTKLRHLDLSHNQLSALPTEIGSLQSLQYLSVAFNSLEALPEELFSCKRLKFLALGNNSINFLSPRVANLVQLVRLEVKGNRLESLPPEIGDCPLLKLSGIVVEQSLLELLPSEVRERMEHS